MTRVLQIPNYFYPNIGGIEQVSRDIADALSLDSTFEQKIICFNENAQDDKHICRRSETVHEMINGVEVIRCGCFTKVASQSLSFSFASELDKVMQSFNPDIVVFHYPNPFESTFLMKYLNRSFRFVLYWHLDIVKQKKLAKLFHSQTIRLLERADQIVATSPLYVDGSIYLSKYRDKCTVIPNCISESRMGVTDEIMKRADEIRQTYKDKIICFGVGRHIPYKGFNYLVDAAKRLDDHYQIIIAGKGKLTSQLKKQAEGDAKVFFPGRISEADLVAYYLAMDIFCFPSITKNEAFGIALAEGMYFGKPAVTFTIPGSGVNYVNINRLTGLEVENSNSSLFAAAIRELGENSVYRDTLGKAARERVQQLFLTETFRANILNMMHSL